MNHVYLQTIIIEVDQIELRDTIGCHLTKKKKKQNILQQRYHAILVQI